MRCQVWLWEQPLFASFQWWKSCKSFTTLRVLFLISVGFENILSTKLIAFIWRFCNTGNTCFSIQAAPNLYVKTCWRNWGEILGDVAKTGKQKKYLRCTEILIFLYTFLKFLLFLFGNWELFTFVRLWNLFRCNWGLKKAQWIDISLFYTSSLYASSYKRYHISVRGGPCWPSPKPPKQVLSQAGWFLLRESPM